MSRQGTTLWSHSDTVKDVAEAIGIPALSDDVSKAMAMDVEYRLHEVIEQARKFMRHSKRRTLTTRDISSALKVLNVEPLYGYDSDRALKFKEALLGSAQTVYYIDEEDEVDLEKLIAEPIPKIPREPTYTAHWLAVEGVQPAIPQNPHVGEIRVMEPSLRGSQVTYSTSKLGQEAEVKPLVKHMISKELQLYFDRIVAALIEDTPSDVSKGVSNDTNIVEKQPNQDAMDINEPTSKEIALLSLRNDPGLHQLTPYFVQLVQEKISTDLTNPEILKTMLDVIDSLLHNQTVYVGSYIHQIVPCVLTVLVSQHIQGGGYEVRDYAASMLRSIVKEFSPQYTNLRPRLTRTLLKGFLDIQRSLESQYGIVRGVEALGPEVTLVIIVYNLSAWIEPISEIGQRESEKDAWSHLRTALTEAISKAPESETAEALKLVSEAM